MVRMIRMIRVVRMAQEVPGEIGGVLARRAHEHDASIPGAVAACYALPLGRILGAAGAVEAGGTAAGRPSAVAGRSAKLAAWGSDGQSLARGRSTRWRDNGERKVSKFQNFKVFEAKKTSCSPGQGKQSDLARPCSKDR